MPIVQAVFTYHRDPVPMVEDRLHHSARNEPGIQPPYRMHYAPTNKKQPNTMNNVNQLLYRRLI